LGNINFQLYNNLHGTMFSFFVSILSLFRCHFLMSDVVIQTTKPSKYINREGYTKPIRVYVREV